MASIDDEKLVLHGRKCLVVHDSRKHRFASGDNRWDCGYAGFDWRGVEGIREEVVVFSLHQLWRKGANGLWTEWVLFHHRMGWESRKFRGHGGVLVHCAGCWLTTLDGLPSRAQSRVRPTLTITELSHRDASRNPASSIPPPAFMAKAIIVSPSSTQASALQLQGQWDRSSAG